MYISDDDLSLPNLVADRYVKVLWRIAVEQNIVNQISRDISVLDSFISEEGRLVNRMSIFKTLANDVVNILCDKYRLSQYTVNMLRLLIENGRIGLLKDVCRSYQKLLYKASGQDMFYITVSDNYGEKDKEEILSIIHSKFSDKAKCVFINGNEIDKSFFGVVIRYKDKVLDYSSKSTVNRLLSVMRGYNEC